MNNISLQGNVGQPWAIAAGDFNGTGVDSLAIADRSTSDVSILLNNGQGKFTQQRPALSLNGPDNPTGIAAADLNGDGNLDLAVVEQSTPTVSIFLGNGNGTFQSASNIGLAGYIRPESITTVPVKGSLFPGLAVTYTEDSGAGGPDGVALLISSGPGTYFPPVYYGLPNTHGARGIVAGDFTDDGQYELAVASDKTSWVNLLSPDTVGNLATFQPGSGAIASAIELGNMQYLQGGDSVTVGPINSTNLITPSTNNPPDYLGDISLPYYPDAAALDLYSPGYFLSVAPAQLQESASGLSFEQSGSIITGWDLVDANGNPIATSTLQDAFGVPVPDTSVTPTIDTGTDLTPTDPSQPFAGLNGGWYYAAAPVPKLSPSGAVIGDYNSWADAFFNWGTGVQGYSPRNLIPNLDPFTGTGQTSGTLTGTSTTFPSDFNYTLTYSAETGARPTWGRP